MRKPLSGVTARGRLPGFRVAPVPETAEAISIPAPVGGLDAISPLAGMEPMRAPTLTNMFPQPGYVEIRGGYARYALLGGDAIESLLPYHGLTSATDALFAATSSVVSNITVAATTTASIALSGMSNARWQHVNFSNTAGNWLHIFNGADVPQMYDGSVWATCSISGITPSSVIGAAVFKERLWLVRANTINPAYLAADAVQGTATPFDLSGVFNEGGFLQAIGTWSVDGGNGPDDRIAFLTSRGEIAVYIGTDPGADFKIVGVYKVGPPLGRRCLLKVGSDLAIICMDGVVSLKVAMTMDRAAAQRATMTVNIQPLINEVTRLYKDAFGWQLLGYPLGTRAILNVPATPAGMSSLHQQQFIMNTVTGAWALFEGEYANCWAVWQDRLFYGDNSGRVYEADCQGFDEGSSIDFDMETAFNYCRSRGRNKQFTMCRPLITSDGNIAPSLAINTDFARDAIGNPVSFSQSGAALWDVALWDVDSWPQESTIIANWVTVMGVGNCVSIRMSGSISAPSGQESDAFTFRVNGFDLMGLKAAIGPG